MDVENAGGCLQREDGELVGINGRMSVWEDLTRPGLCQWKHLALIGPGGVQGNKQAEPDSTSRLTK